MTKPITPEEAGMGKPIPEIVIAVVNQLIKEKYVCGYSATVKQEDIVDRLVKEGIKREEIFDKGWLNIETLYSTAGWKIEYDKPGYNEEYPATFIFTRKNKIED